MRYSFVSVAVATAWLAACSASAPHQDDALANSASQPEVIEDVVYGHKFGLAMTFNVFRPPEPNGAGVIFVNSAGFRSPFEEFITSDATPRRLMTDDELEDVNAYGLEFSPRPLLSRGFTVFDVRHGSIPRFQVPEIVTDMRRAVRYIKHHASEFGVDSDRLGLWGGSAGGYLSLMLGAGSELGNEGATDDFELGPGDVAAVVSYFPFTDLLRFVPDGPRPIDPSSGLNFDRDLYQAYSPISYASPDDPPILIIHGDQDELVPIIQGRSMYEALLASGVTTEFIVIQGAGHGFYDSDADRAAAEMVAWFEQHLGSG